MPAAAFAPPASRGEPALTLYRDTNAWCPFCERVWLALEHKGIAYDTEFIDLRNKPEWYKEMVPTALVPAARFAADDKLVWESDALLREIEERFPDAPRLVPEEGSAERERYDAFMGAEVEGDGALTAVGYRYLVSGADDARDELDAALDRVEHYFADGFVCGGDGMTLADVLVAPSMSRLVANLPTFRAHDGLRERCAPWFEAMASVPAYARVRADAETHNTVVRQLFGLAAGRASVPAPAADADAEARGALEAGARLADNFEAVVADALANSGVDAESDEVREAVEAHLQALAGCLLDAAEAGGRPGCSRPISPCATPGAAELKKLEEEGGDVAAVRARAARMRAAGAAALAFERGRVSAPRDMSADAAAAFRAACDACLAGLY